MAVRKNTQEKVNDANMLKVLTTDDLKVDLEKRTISSTGFSLWIRQLKQNWRQGTVACKGRSDVSFSNKKPWKQKGTGRARAGSARSPLWRGGGVIFGPQARVRVLKVSHDLKQGILNTLFWNFLDQGNIIYGNWNVENQIPKTSQAYQWLKQSDMLDKKVVLFLSPTDRLTYKAFINIPNVTVVFFDAVNAFDLAHADQWIVLNKDFESFKEMVSKWI